MEREEHVDVLIVGAGLSGIGAAVHLQTRRPDHSYAILEMREAMGGTWDLFRYPGIRSDSDMYTLGYSFKPWTNAKAIADGPSIRAYVEETAREHEIESRVRFGIRVRRASWSSEAARWTVEAERVATGETIRLTCGFLHMCAGYYNYDAGYTPEFKGRELFAGRVVHPQHWPEDLDYAGQRVLVIGSGATAVTLVPELASQAAHVTMVQRSPTYVVSRPAEDAIANWLRRWLPAKLAYGIVRWKNVLLQMFVFNRARKRPERVKQFLIDRVRESLGPDYDVETHFTPRYDPWDQRLCLVPDEDLFAAIREGRASVVTDRIETFTEKGLRLESGRELEADLIVTATGLDLQLMGGLDIEVDGRPVEAAESLTYKGMMYSGIPNLSSSMGYTNASWTLKCDLTAEYLCRLLGHMRDHGYVQCTPRRDPDVGEEPWADFSSGYIQRALDRFPRQGTRKPWRMHQNYALDLLAFRLGRVDDGTLEFRRPPAVPSPQRVDAGASASSARAPAQD